LKFWEMSDNISKTVQLDTDILNSTELNRTYRCRFKQLICLHQYKTYM